VGFVSGTAGIRLGFYIAGYQILIAVKLILHLSYLLCVKCHYIYLAVSSSDEVDFVIDTLCSTNYFILTFSFLFCVYSCTMFILNKY